MRNTFFFRLLLLVTGCMMYCYTFAQQFNFRNYSVGEGLAQSQVFAMTEDQKGRIWFGTRGGGISVFDGLQFRTFTRRDGLLNDFIFCLYADRKGQLYIGSNAGLTVYDGLTFRNYPLFFNDNPVGVSALAEDRQGRIWLATAKGIYLLEKENLFPVSFSAPTQPEVISTVFIDKENQVWFGDDNGLNRLDSAEGGLKNTLFARAQGFTNVLVRVIRQKGEDLLVGTYGGGVFLFKNERAVPVSWNAELKSRIIHDLLPDRKGNWWIATYDAGIYRFAAGDSSLSAFSENEGLANNNVSSLLEDSRGNIWVGTSGGGVSRYAGEQFVHYTHRNGLIGNYVYAVCAASDSSLWLGTSAKGVIRLRQGTLTHYGLDSGFVEEKVKAIFQDSKGQLWLGTEGAGLWKYDDSLFVQYTVRQGLSSNWIKDIAEDASGQLWLATAGGGISVLTFEEETYRVRKILPAQGLSKNRVNCLHIDARNRVWYGTEGGGVGVITGDSIYNFTAEEGFKGSSVRALREDRNGFLWAGTGGDGLNRIDIYKGNHIRHFTRDQGLTSDNIYLLETDNEGNLWVGSDNGLDYLALNEDSEVQFVKHYGKAEGFPGIETCQNAACRMYDGSLWFGTIKGLTRHSPGRAEKNTLAPSLFITGITLFYQPFLQTRFADARLPWGEIQDGWKLAYHENHIGFEFLGIDQRNPVSVRYRWKLEGFDRDWSPISDKRDVTYSNLPPGAYRFLIQAVNEDGVWTEEPRAFAFEIEPPLWQRLWFRLTLYGVGALIVLSVVWAWISRIKRKNKAFREALELEKKMVELEQKALRLQMNPHFIFHALNSIQTLILRQDADTARLYLSKFSKLMRAILENSVEPLIPLEKEIKTLEDYLSLEQFTRNQSFDYHIRIEDGVEAEAMYIPSLLLQPFVENSLIHGFNGLDRRGKIEVLFRMEKEHLICVVRDNGVGLKKSAGNNFQRDSQHKSMALAVTQERLQTLNRLGGHPEQHIQFRELTNEQRAVCGTEVIIRLIPEYDL